MSGFSVLRPEHIGYYGARVTVFPKRTRRKLLNEHSLFVKRVCMYRIEGLEAIEVERYFHGKKMLEREGIKVPLHMIYKQIKQVYDHDGVLIARRNQPNQPLKVTGKGMGKFLQYEK
ncbi:TPA: type IV conjugative transfer system protein TraE [Enterococcus faecalis]